MTECNHEDKYWVPRDEDPGCEDGKWVCRDCGAEREKGYRPFLEEWRLPESTNWPEGGILVYVKSGSIYLGQIINAAGDIQPLALVLVSRERFEEALSSITYLREFKVKNVD